MRRQAFWRRMGLVVATAAALAALTCSSLDQFRIEQSSSATIEKGTLVEQLVGDVGFGGFIGMDLTKNAALENQGVQRNQIDSVHVESFTLEITNPPQGQDFTFIDSLRFYVEAEGLERRLVASGGPFEPGLQSVGLDVEDVDLADYAAAASMNIKAEVSGRRPENTTTILATIVLNVDVDVTGAACK